MTVEVWGVVNATPDSFSDGGRFANPEAAIAHGLTLAGQGAAVLDVGGESARPGAEPVSEAEELARILPVIKGLVAAGAPPVSVDTTKPAVARAAVEAGATIWNDISALTAPGAPAIAANLRCGVALMHMQGSPLTMQRDPAYGDVVAEVEAFLLARAEAAMAAGVERGAIRLDPGIGFGKTLAHNLALLNALPRLARHGFPLLVGVSRKRSVMAIDPTAVDPADRIGGSIAFALHAARSGARAVRVHDVRETVQALAVDEALRQDFAAAGDPP